MWKEVLLFLNPAEISLKRRKSSKQPTNQPATLYIASALIRVLGPLLAFRADFKTMVEEA